MPLRYLFKQLLLPPGGLFLLLLLAWWWRARRPRLALACGVLGLGGLWLSSLPVAVEWGGRLLEREPALATAEWPALAQRAEAIVVLGGGRERGDPGWGGDQPSLSAMERARFAARLHKASGLPLLVSGGLHYGAPPSEAELLAAVLQEDFGVAVRWQEGASRTTWENATLSAPLLRAAGVRRIVLVTQAPHMPRARWCFERLGFAVVAAPMGFLGVANARPWGGWLPEAAAVWQSGQLLNEAAGLLAYPLVYR
ncbi:YdcF family protein [Pseudomonas sp. MAP12]|uniref:YdcF family protein n=1 Tax=Geopseudomonas aromaticivorans TaxID=2849492 RepID=A0ABS6MYJ5_9GAMM|nr:YdcF family protein [Pseudomonas aromaticivorans]MBV2133884.1 YdcF family protein [Pseudomonas aromaticivorans]